MTYGVHLIAAVGQSGQLGLRGKVPWHGDPKYADATARNNAEFLRLTEGGILILGSVTARGLFGNEPPGRQILIWHRQMVNIRSGDLLGTAALLKDLRAKHPHRNIWICGGEMIYQLFMPYVDWHHIAAMPYDGAADTWMPPIIPGWKAYDYDPNVPGPETITRPA